MTQEYAVMQWPPPSSMRQMHTEKTAADEPSPPALTYDTSLPFLVKQAAAFVSSRYAMEKIASEQTNLWRDPEAHPLVLVMALLDLYGEESMEWDGEVLRVTLIRDGRQPISSVWAKIQAARVLLNSPSPWRRWEVFHWVALGLSGEAPNFIYLEGASLGHVGAAVDMMRMVDPTRETADEVDKYCAAVLKQDGFAWAPPPLDFAQDELEDRQLHCLDCTAIHRNDNDTHCVTCGGTRLELAPYEFAELRDEVAALFTKFVDQPLSAAEAGLPETAAGISAYALLEKWEYVEEIRLRLARQLKALKA